MERKESEQNAMFTLNQACAYLAGINEDTLLYYRRLGLAYYKKGKDGVWYQKGDIDVWLATGRVSHHSPKK
jgi:hypothetical protein